MSPDLPPGTCPDEPFDEPHDLYSDGFDCYGVCGAPEMPGRLIWRHDFPYSIWTPDGGYETCFAHIVSITPITCGVFHPGRWEFMLEAYRRDDRTHPPTLCYSYALYTMFAGGNQDIPNGRYYLHPTDHPCDSNCPEEPWHDSILLEFLN